MEHQGEPVEVEAKENSDAITAIERSDTSHVFQVVVSPRYEDALTCVHRMRMRHLEQDRRELGYFSLLTCVTSLID